MPRALDVVAFLETTTPMIDVRSPGEFARGHIPGAHSLPLFSDEERAVVGTLYKQQGRDAAVLEGLRIVGPKLASIVEQARALAPDGRIRVHCWRGGERSGSVAWLLDKAGFAEVITLKRGYKAFRNHVLASFDAPLPLIILGGYTGSGKTEILHALRALGEQVVDMEGLANHRGSSFGALGLPPQPTTEHFENLLWNDLRALDRSRTIWLEDESIMIGRAKVPDGVFGQLRAARVLFIDMPQDMRAQRLVKDYGAVPKAELADAINRIGKRLGPQHCKAALEALEAGDLHTAALTALTYYDKAYLRGCEERVPSSVKRIVVDGPDSGAIAKKLITLVSEKAVGT
ncbi:MAG: tRNA 2-selenouridine(34) synthase MnmH [Flavobacteriales bacterium]